MPSQQPSPPSRQVERAAVTLAGLSFGEHDGGLQRREVSVLLADVLHLWTSGLLDADHGAAEVSAVAAAFETLVLTTPRLPSLLHWPSIPDDTVALLISLLFKRALDFLLAFSPDDHYTPQPPDDLLPVRTASKTLSVVHTLLQALPSSSVTRVLLSTSSEALAAFLLSAARVRSSLSRFPSCVHNRAQVLETLASVQSLYESQRSAAASSNLNSRVFPVVLRLSRAPLRAEASQTSPRQQLESLQLSPFVDAVADILARTTDIEVISRHIRLLLDVLDGSLDHVESSIRISTLDILNSLWDRLPHAVLQAEARIVTPLLEASLLWNHPPTSHRTLPLLAELLPALLPDKWGHNTPPLSQATSDEWESAATTLLKTVEQHASQALTSSTDEEPNDEKSSVSHAVAAAQLSAIPIQALKFRLLSRVSHFARALARLLPRVAALARRGDLDVTNVSAISASLVELVSWCWPRVDGFRPTVFAGCVTSVLEVKDGSTKVRDAVHIASTSVLRALAAVDGKAFNYLLDASKHTMSKYPTLQVAHELLTSLELSTKASLSSPTLDPSKKTSTAFV